jgi:hypothetical protein
MHQTAKVKHDFATQEIQRTQDALDRRNKIDYECFLKLSQLLPFIDDRDRDVKEAVEEAKELIRERDRANHEFLGALAGRSLTRPRSP